MIAVFILYMLFASTFTFGKMALNYCDPIFFIAVRMLVGGTLLLGYCYFFNRVQWRWAKKDSWAYLQLMLFHIYCAFVLEFWALQYVNAAKACLIYNLSPFITALYAYFLFSERLTTQKWISLGIGFAGFLPILLVNMPLEFEFGTFFALSFPELALLGAVLSSAYGWIIMKELLNKNHSPVQANGIAMLGGGALAAFTSLIFEGTPRLKMPVMQDHPPQWIIGFAGEYTSLLMFLWYTLLLIIIANIICYNLYGALLKRFSATFLSFAGFITPLFAAFYDWIFIGAAVGWPFFTSFFITFLGIYSFYYQELQHDMIEAKKKTLS